MGQKRFAKHRNSICSDFKSKSRRCSGDILCEHDASPKLEKQDVQNCAACDSLVLVRPVGWFLHGVFEFTLAIGQATWRDRFDQATT